MKNGFDDFFTYLVLCVMANVFYPLVPRITDYPMLSGKNEIRIDAGVVPIEKHASISYGVTDNLLIQGNCGFGGADYLKHASGQLAAGWYKNMENHAVVEVFGGARTGIVGHGNRHCALFLQGGYGWRDLANSHIDFALGLKCGMFLYSSPDKFYNMPFLEPSICFRFGWEKLKFNLLAGYNFNSQTIVHSMVNITTILLSLNYHFTPQENR